MESGVNDWQAQTAGQQVVESEGVLTGFSFLFFTAAELGVHSRKVTHLRASPSLVVEPRAEPRSLAFPFSVPSVIFRMLHGATRSPLCEGRRRAGNHVYFL